MERSSGILMHISSLPSVYGIGTFGKSAYEFVDFLSDAGQKYWQVLPLGPTGYGDSPYQSFSTYAGNPYFIDFDLLKSEGLLKSSDLRGIDFGDNLGKVDYYKQYMGRFEVLRKAYSRGIELLQDEFFNFAEVNCCWLDDYALYTAVKKHFENKPWNEWNSDIRDRKKSAIGKYSELLNNEITFYKFIQFLFFKQWNALKKYANNKGIKIIGDIPIYVAADSADAWSNSNIFLFDDDRNPAMIAGCPPDCYSEIGQLWGNPLYNWSYLEKTGFKWWVERVKHSLEIFDVIRIDHFRGFESYFAIPFGAETGALGHWEKGPGMKLFNAIQKNLGDDLPIIAEDLGFLTDEVIKFREQSGFPSMKVLQFAFDCNPQNWYLPHNYDKNTVVYTGTHDNDTTLGWYNGHWEQAKEYAKKYLNVSSDKDIIWAFIRLAMSSVSNLAIIPMQDVLGIGSEGRMNTPSTMGDNWTWRMQKGQCKVQYTKKLKELTELFGR